MHQNFSTPLSDSRNGRGTSVLISLPLSLAGETLDETTPAHPREDVLLALIAWIQLDTIIVLPWHYDIRAVLV